MYLTNMMEELSLGIVITKFGQVGVGVIANRIQIEFEKLNWT